MFESRDDASRHSIPVFKIRHTAWFSWKRWALFQNHSTRVIFFISVWHLPSSRLLWNCQNIWYARDRREGGLRQYERGFPGKESILWGRRAQEFEKIGLWQNFMWQVVQLTNFDFLDTFFGSWPSCAGHVLILPHTRGRSVTLASIDYLISLS